MTTGDISAHFAEICGASVSTETTSRITDKVVAEMNEWVNGPLGAVYAAVFVDAIMVKVRDGQVVNRPGLRRGVRRAVIEGGQRVASGMPCVMTRKLKAFRNCSVTR